jgi:hypothetical protein
MDQLRFTTEVVKKRTFGDRKMKPGAQRRPVFCLNSGVAFRTGL